MGRIFVSHAASDGSDIARQLVSGIELAGHSCWIAPRDVTPGKTYPAQIMAAIRDGVGLVLVATSNANSSLDVLQEIQIAHSLRKTIIPVVVDGAKLSDDLGYFLNVRQHLPWTAPEDVVPATLRALGLSGSSEQVLTASQAIAAAAATEDGVVGLFRITVANTAWDESTFWLNSENDYRDPRCLSVAIDSELMAALASKLGGEVGAQLAGRSVRVRGVAKKTRIDFLAGGKRSGYYYFQTHVRLAHLEDLILDP